MLGLLFIGIVLVLALYGLVSGFRNRAFRAGRGRRPVVIPLPSKPIAYWTAATLLSVTSGVCLAYLLHAMVHR